jgi:hypothetical protein
VDADDHEGLVLQLAFQPFQHGNGVEAIDSGVRPEVQEDDPSA